MNKQIAKLAEQCVIKEYHSNGIGYEAGFDREKFARLIIEECSNIAFKAAPSDESACDISEAIDALLVDE
jgi:hypothetical protein